LPRANRLERPPVANVDQLVAVMSLKEPECDWQLISRILVMAEKEGLSAFVCLNKTDLVDQEELERIASECVDYPYPIVYTSASRCSGLDDLKLLLKGSCSVFAGPSGVGKSSLLNAIQPGLLLKTGLLSDKIKRGKHTTRQATLLPLHFGGSVVDTPGFSRLDFSQIEADHLADFFPEFAALRSQCPFRDCRHLREPDCAVRREIGKSLSPLRYDHYKYFFAELSREEVF
jgi:ribosome biogenesis GTPase / thiamine phosphate phosphatase